MDGRQAVAKGILRGDSPGEIYQETFVMEDGNGKMQDVEVTIFPRRLSQEEQQEWLELAVCEFEQTYLGDNPSEEQVYKDMIFAVSFCQGMVQAQYESSHPEWIWEDGSVSTDEIDPQGVLVTIRVLFTCQDSMLDYTCCVKAVPPVLSAAQQKLQTITAVVEQSEEESRADERFVLPTTINGQLVTWHKKPGREPFVFLLLATVAVIAVIQKKGQDEKQQKIKRQQELLRGYPQMVTQLSLLMGAGMNLSVAWECIVKRYLLEQVDESKDKGAQKQQYLEEMLVTYREIKDGRPIRKAYQDFGNRVMLAPYRKMIAMLLQNMDKGNRDLLRLLDLEAEIALENQKNQVRRQGEEAGTKLLFPMLLLFIMILVVIMVPAMQSF